MEDNAVVVISPPSSTKRLSKITCKQEELKPHICLKNNMDMEDCFILDCNPFDSIDISKLSITIDDADDDDLSLVAEKGKVACRDYPHSRHLCVRFPFDKTAHDKHCDLCYCYVCDSVAPCKVWAAHCDASEHVQHCRSERNLTILKRLTA
ncbi:uncharacterized protein LOC120197026 [Hibiscus syriacus]|uniref:uncharacterized protein LOC120197026 n=1 Tax=Hibiscus syriacus TaxID=106335 RepID=UPI001922DA76|nr:uncharacterized protein LOC120197026 [Hibiscus syriacus]